MNIPAECISARIPELSERTKCNDKALRALAIFGLSRSRSSGNNSPPANPGVFTSLLNSAKPLWISRIWFPAASFGEFKIQDSRLTRTVCRTFRIFFQDGGLAPILHINAFPPTTSSALRQQETRCWEEWRNTTATSFATIPDAEINY